MNRCEQCGNAYGQTFTVTMNGASFTFDSFECAIEMLAPHCQECGTRVIGHGVESNGRVFCCAHCARMEGVTDLVDHSVSDEISNTEKL